ncbi:hypothetical protein [Desulfosarcina ovata]|uniref:Uncharacterized protein n=1 Tax=Desulfosarcina ovata subsp. ovata TaxID=2752305 RepID=A0A5K8ACS8_9BACT|nr:hypothetical protein [Desulfosarcina ovata]BBO90425.1 hypothetical protein DSCOOX_36050 [Desulfosarcina ovata subsp. ovata]
MHMHHSSTKEKPKMDPNATLIKLDLFHKNADGSWSSIKNADIRNAFGTYRIKPGMTFRKNHSYWGIDVVSLLENAEIVDSRSYPLFDRRDRNKSRD